MTGRVVIVENRLEVSDHTHLGRILTCAAGTDPTTTVWVAAGFRPEHRAAIDRLNARTDEDTCFFAVQIGVVRIGASAPTPSSELVAQPNDWEKTVRTATKEAEAVGEQALHRAFWERWLASELDFGSPDPDLNTRRLEALLAAWSEFESAYGADVEWQPFSPGRRTSGARGRPPSRHPRGAARA